MPFEPGYPHSQRRGRMDRTKGSNGSNWVGHRPGPARLWMGVGAIGAFGSISGSVSSHVTRLRSTPRHHPSLRYRGTSLIRNSPPSWDHHRTLDSPYCRVLGGGCFSWARYPCTCHCEMRDGKSGRERSVADDASLCEVTPVILHGVVCPDLGMQPLV
jgi:hypothetical protein